MPAVMRRRENENKLCTKAHRHRVKSKKGLNVSAVADAKLARLKPHYKEDDRGATASGDP